MGLQGLEVRERWFWRKRDGFVGFEGEEERFWGEGQPWMTVKKIFQKNWILIVCVWVYCFICKMLTWHFPIGGCKTQFYTSSLLNLISYGIYHDEAMLHQH